MKNEVLKSWNDNAKEWIKTIDGKKIPSRVFTNNAIVNVLQSLPVSKILDCGCGEGWLTRAISNIGKKATGIDGTLQLIENAKSKGNESFYHMNYAAICNSTAIPDAPFEAAVFNFSLYQKNGLDLLLKGVKNAICENGFIVIQTIHPFYLEEQGLPLKSQWIKNSWKGLSGNFVNGHSWYARTLEDWRMVFADSGVTLEEEIEVKNSDHTPLSVIFILKKQM